MRTSFFIGILLLLAPTLSANSAPYFRPREARAGIEWIRDGLRVAYRENGNKVNSRRTAQELAHGKLTQLHFVNPEDFAIRYASDKPQWARIECQNVYELREGPLVLEVDLANGTERWIEPKRGTAGPIKEALYISALLVSLAFVPVVLAWFLRRRTALTPYEKFAFWSAGCGWWAFPVSFAFSIPAINGAWDGSPTIFLGLLMSATLAGFIAAMLGPLVVVARGWGLLMVQLLSSLLAGVAAAGLVRESETYRPFAPVAGVLVSLWVFLHAYSRYRNQRRERVGSY